MDEAYACGRIARRLAQLRAAAPDEAKTRREWTIANGKYRDHVLEGRGDSANGEAISTYYIERQAYFLYAKERGFSLEVM